MGRRYSKESPTQGGTVCKRCGHYNPPDSKICGNCEKDLFDTAGSGLVGKALSGQRFTLFHGIGIFLLVIGIIVGLIVGFEVYVRVHWLGSVILTSLIVFFIKPWRAHREKYDPGVVFLFFAFMALMGMSLDQGGNFIYNQPIRLICCEANEQLSQELMQYNVRPGERVFTRDFYCVNEKGEAHPVSMWSLLGIRFLWYLLMCYLFYAVKYAWPAKTKRE